MHSTNEGISANKEVFGYLMQQPDRMVNAIEQLLRSDILQTGDKSLLFAIKRNLELGMEKTDVHKRIVEVAKASPQLIALFLAYSVYSIYDKN
ncbi:MAG: hypothetical protein AABX38_07440 [Candidatus Micrarchaeota archaeon]